MPKMVGERVSYLLQHCYGVDMSRYFKGAALDLLKKKAEEYGELPILLYEIRTGDNQMYLPFNERGSKRICRKTKKCKSKKS